MKTEQIIKELPRLVAGAEGMRDLLLADVVMIGEILSPTFGEQERIRFIGNRFAEYGLQACALDEKGNGSAVLPGAEGRRNLLVAAHADTIVAAERDQVIEVAADRLIGPFVGDNCLALAALTTLPALLERLQIRLRSNLVLLASTRALGRGNLDGLRFFLANSGTAFRAGLCLESVQLGRLNYQCIGMLRGEIVCRLPDDYDWAQYGSTGTIIPMGEVINRISRIPLPQRPLTSLVMGTIHGGIAHNNIARETRLGFEVRSEALETLQQIREQIDDIVEELSAQTGKRITLDILAQRAPGGMDIAHPLVRSGRAILQALGLQPMLYPTTSQMAAMRDAQIPALTLGISRGERRHELDEIDESVELGPIPAGLAQLVGLLLAMDEEDTP